MNPKEARAAVQFFAQRGYEQLKIYNSIPPSLVPALAEEAHARGMRVSGHVPVGMIAEDAVRAGYDELQHINMLFLNFLADRSTDTSTPLRFTLVAEGAGSLDLASKPVQDFVALLLERKTVVDPTLAVFEMLFVDRPGRMAHALKAAADRLPLQVRREGLRGGLVVPEGKDETYRRAFRASLQMVKHLHDAGVPVVAGTDAVPALWLPRELELLVEAGLEPEVVLQMATLGAARVMGLDKELGSITAGKKADVIVVDGDPAARMGDLRRVSTVVKDGIVYDTAALWKSAGVKPPGPG